MIDLWKTEVSQSTIDAIHIISRHFAGLGHEFSNNEYSLRENYGYNLDSIFFWEYVLKLTILHGNETYSFESFDDL